MQKKYPPVVVVDENDIPVGTAPLPEVLQKGLYHRIVAIFVVDDQNRMLLQLRGPAVKIYPNRWDQAAGGHVDAGQSYKDAAAAEIAEELDLHNVSLTTVATYRSNERDGDHIINQFERVFKATVPHDITLKPELTELTELRWFTSAELQSLITTQPDILTPGLLYDIRHFFPEFWP
jgi:isopentenyldiphosphate isomerase